MNFLLLLFVIFCVTSSTVSSNQAPSIAKLNPKIVKNYGGKVKILCYLDEGSRPLRFAWQKNGQPLNTGGSTTLQIDTDHEQSQLSISRLEVHDAGNYSCTVENDFGVDRVSTLLVVQGKTFASFLFHFTSTMWRICCC